MMDSPIFASSLGLDSPMLQIPILLSATRFTALAMTPTTAPATQQEKEGYGDKTDPMGTVVQRTRPFYGLRRGIYWANAIIESTVLIAEHFPSPASDAILAFLIRDSLRTTHHIRITPAWLAGCALMHCGSFIRLACYRTLGRFFTWELSIKRGHVLVTDGPYAVVRHPGYTGVAMIAAGVLLCNFGPGSWYAECVGWDTWGSRVFTAVWAGWTVMVPTLLFRRMGLEDNTLRDAFGEEWERYAQRTPYRLIPYIY